MDYLRKHRFDHLFYPVSWFIGVSIQITPISITDGLVLNIGISIAGDYQNRTFGLLGLYDQNPDNDLRAQNGTIIGPLNTLTLEQIHRQFGQTWAINPSRSLFYYESNDSPLNYAYQNLFYIPSFVESPDPPLSQINSTLAACGIDPTLTNNRTAWTISQQTCYYDIAVTHDISLGETSRIAAETLFQIAIDQRYPPEFNSNLPLTLTINESTSVTIDFTAHSQYTSTIIYTLVQGPSSVTFNNQLTLFHWPRPSLNDNGTVIRVTAQDTLYNLLSTHELIVYLIDTGTDDITSKPTPSSAEHVFSISSIIILINIVEIFDFF